MIKKDLRKEYRAARLALSAAQQSKWDDLILIQFQRLVLPAFDTILSFYPLQEKNEINTFLLTDFLQFRNPGLIVCYPQTNLEQSTMAAVATTDETVLQKNKYGLDEPVFGQIVESSFIDIVLVPMLVFDKKGNRVGYGKGFYDRYLQQCRPDCLKIGLCYFQPVAAIDDADEYDVPLDYCITPQFTYVF